jgi:hypothetical protein
VRLYNDTEGCKDSDQCDYTYRRLLRGKLIIPQMVILYSVPVGGYDFGWPVAMIIYIRGFSVCTHVGDLLSTGPMGEQQVDITTSRKRQSSSKA